MTEEELEGAHERISKGEELKAVYEDLISDLEGFENVGAVIRTRENSLEVDEAVLFEGGEPNWEFDFSSEIIAFKKAIIKKVQKMIDKIKREFDRL